MKLQKIIIILTLVSLTIFTACTKSTVKGEQTNSIETEQDSEPKEEKRRSVKIVKMFPIPLEDILKLPGSVEPFQEVNLSTQISGIVDKILVDEGTPIKKDQVLFQLESKQLKASYERAMAQKEHYQKQFVRQQGLQKDRVSSEEELDLSELNLKTSTADLSLAKINYDWASIKSPIDGILDRRHIELGEYIQPGDPIAKIVSIEKVKIIVNIPEKDILYFNKGDQVKVISNHKKNQYQTSVGTIEFLSMSSDPLTRTFPIKIEVDNKSGMFRPGMIVQAELLRRKNQQALAVPFFAIIDREDGKGVFIEENGIAKEVRIEIGIIRKGLVEVTAGIKQGDNLIIVGQRELVDQEKVNAAEDITPIAIEMLQSGEDLSELALKLL